MLGAERPSTARPKSVGGYGESGVAREVRNAERLLADSASTAVEFSQLFDPALDELRSGMRGGKNWIAKLQQDEIARTGIQSLKVRFNSVFGYYIEVTKSNLEKVPAHYVRKQAIANGERFITPELKEMEAIVVEKLRQRGVATDR